MGLRSGVAISTTLNILQVTACLPVRFRRHVDAIGLSYGTALMSRQEMSNPQAVTFNPSLTLVPTGFVVSTISWPGRDNIDIDVVSVHLDFMSGWVRKKQADELIAVLRARNNHLIIIMGDMNSGWLPQDSAPQYLVEKLGLKAYQPENSKLITFPCLANAWTGS